MGNTASIDQSKKHMQTIKVAEKTNTKSISPRDYDVEPDPDSSECYLIISNKLKSLPPVGSRGQNRAFVHKKLDITYSSPNGKTKHVLSISKPKHGSYELYYDNDTKNVIYCTNRQCVLDILSTLNIIDAKEADHTDPAYLKSLGC